MSRLLEILGRAVAINTAELIYNWLNTVKTQSQTYLGSSEFDEVLELLSEAKLVKAQEKLRFYLFENPACTLGRMAAAAIALHNNNLNEAIENLQSVYLRQPNNTMALYVLGHCYERLGNESQAIEFYQDCLKFKHYLQLPRERLAAIYFKNGQLQKTIAEYELLIEEYPDDIPALITLGHLYIASQQYILADDTFNKAILIHPDNFHADQEFLEIEPLIQNGELYEAQAQILERLEKQPERADLNIKLADIYVLMGQDADGLVYYDKALKLQPNCLEATVKLGTHHLRMNHHTIAARYFNNAVEINDQIVDAYLGLAIAQKLSGKQQRAISTMSLAAGIQPNSTLLFAETATLQIKAAHTDTDEFTSQSFDISDSLIPVAIEAHRRQLITRPHNSNLHYRYGLLLMEIRNLPAAISAFTNALNINPTFYRARTRLALCLYEMDKKQAAIDELTKTDHLDNEIVRLHYETALLYCDRQRFASAIQNLQKSYEANFTLTETFDNISLVLQNLGLLDRPTVIWNRLAETTNQTLSGDDF